MVWREREKMEEACIGKDCRDLAIQSHTYQETPSFHNYNIHQFIQEDDKTIKKVVNFAYSFFSKDAGYKFSMNEAPNRKQLRLALRTSNLMRETPDSRVKILPKAVDFSANAKFLRLDQEGIGMPVSFETALADMTSSKLIFFGEV